ncbi:hypothetical protein HHK36_002737 [Tetracentron sinense]|uniref:CUE domain-containing protein n=1 Tax=Tetracentron sinense TaxID=13715 RepID=A0A834ZMK8_TETSI|nr:hypothetical protein HHK36_002737 [Tetracentron sinense]
MSARSAQNKHDGNKGFIKTQKKFVPKSNNSTVRESHNNPSLTTSLRQSDDVATSSSTATSNTRVRSGEKGDWDSSRNQGGNFVNYLPQDEAVAAGLGVEDGGLDPIESQRVADLLNKELCRLLKLNPRDFWREVASDLSLHNFLDGFLQYRSRWYDFPHHGAKGTVAGVIVGEFELSRRVFMALYRISSNRDPGAPASNSLSPKEHEALLQEKKLLDLPKLFDICAIYGHENQELTRSLVMNAMKAQPMFHEKLTAVMSHFLSIVHTMHQRCSSSLEVMDFINDAMATMDAFVDAFKPATIYFCCPVEMSYGNGEILSTLARLHDSLLPSLQRGLGHIFKAGADEVQNSFGGMLSITATSFKMLSMRLVKFGWKLLDFCYLSNEAFESSLPHLSATKMFPAEVEDPVIRGDILVQTFREISGEVSNHVQENQHSRTFLQNVEKNYKILSRLEGLRDTGWIFMDDEQFQYLSHIIVPRSKVTTKEPNVTIPMANNKVRMDENAAIMESKISQIKDLFPDYGKGFLSACLEVYNQNPEEVIQRILEGTLHEDLQSLDISLEKIPPPKASSSMSGNDKGKGALLESTALPSRNIVAAVGEQHTGASSSSSSAPVGRFTRKSKVDFPHSGTLDSRDDKNSGKTAALALQYEYEDEYDDSFDDLGLSLVESGFEETESLRERISSTPGKSWGAETEGSAPNTSGSKWNSRKKPQFFVKDGKNYSYKVAGSVEVANSHEAAVVNQSQKELIHGLGRGGNLPLGAVKMLTESNEHQDDQSPSPGVREMGGRGNPGTSRGRGRRGGGEHQDDQSPSPDVTETGGRGNPGTSRGRGRRGGGNNNFRKDRAMKKHFAGLGGF